MLGVAMGVAAVIVVGWNIANASWSIQVFNLVVYGGLDA